MVDRKDLDGYLRVQRGKEIMSGALGPVLPYFMIVSLLLSSAIPTLERIHGSIARQYARVALAIVGVSDPSTYRLPGQAGSLLGELFPSSRNHPSLVLYDEGREVPTAREWRKLESRLGKLERLGHRLARDLDGGG